jgi:hypothetical protein
MSLREKAEAVLLAAIENSDLFGQAVTVINPSGTTLDTVGLCNDIAQSIDPQTGVVISGRQVSVALRLSSLSVFSTLPIAVPESAGRPWLVRFADILGAERTFKVRETYPDRTLGVLVLILEAYNA